MREEKRKLFANAKRQYIFTLVTSLLAIIIIVNYTFLSFYIIARKDATTIGEKSVSEQSEKLNNFLLKVLM